MTRRRIIVLLAALLPAVLLAGAVVAARSGSSSHRPARLPVAASAGATALATADNALAPASARLYPYGGIVYDAGPDLPSLDGSGRAYRLAADSVGEDSIRRLAAALGLSGDPVAQDGGGLLVQDGERVLNVYPQAGGSWSYSPSSTSAGVISSGVATATASPACPANADCGVPVPPDTIVEPPPPERPADLPSQDEARAQALDVLGSAGIDVDGADVHVDDGFTQWSVRVDPVVDGVPTSGFTSYVAVGPHGDIEFANGYLARPVAADEYPIIGTKDAIDRLNKGEGFGGGIRPMAADAGEGSAPATGGGTAGSATADSGTVGSGTAASEPVPAPSPDAKCESTTSVSSDGGVSANGCAGTGVPTQVDPVPPDQVPTEPPVTIEPPQPQHVTITGARQVLIFTPSFDGTEGWLVPGYAFSTADGDGPVVFAVDGQFFQPPGIVPDGKRVN